MSEQKGFVSAGAGLLWRRQGILWWIFAVNFICAGLGTAPAAFALNRALHHTLAGQSLVKGFDLGMAYELIRLPGVGLLRYTTSSYMFAFLFALFMLFVSGGILEAYRQNRRLTMAEFFAASGAFFWRFVRLMLFSLVPLIFLGSLYAQLDTFSDYVGDKVLADRTGFYIMVAGMAILALLALLVRLWFDIAKIRAVAQNEHSMWRNMWKALGITRRRMGTLLWMYVRISLVAWIALLACILIWTTLPPTATIASFLLLQLVIVGQLATRLWQLASITAWYQHAELASASSVDSTTPHPQEVVEPAPSFSDATSRPEDFELPPADA